MKFWIRHWGEAKVGKGTLTMFGRNLTPMPLPAITKCCPSSRPLWVWLGLLPPLFTIPDSKKYFPNSTIISGPTPHPSPDCLHELRSQDSGVDQDCSTALSLLPVFFATAKCVAPSGEFSWIYPRSTKIQQNHFISESQCSYFVLTKQNPRLDDKIL